MYRIDIGAAAAHTMYTVPALNRFNPHTARTFNRGANSGAALRFQYNGTGAASVVANALAAALNQGIRNQVVVQDSIVGAGTLQYEITIASGAGAGVDFADASVTGKLT